MIAGIQSFFVGMQLQTSVQKNRQDFEMDLQLVENKKKQLLNEIDISSERGGGIKTRMSTRSQNQSIKEIFITLIQYNTKFCESR